MFLSSAFLNDDNEQYSSGSGGDEMSDDEASESLAASEPKEEDALRAQPAGLQLTSTTSSAASNAVNFLHRNKHKSGQMKNGEDVTCSSSGCSSSSSSSSFRKRQQQLAKIDERLPLKASARPKIVAKQKEV
uniref:Uncharacterized protein n=1 Tax=Syphacia muris TaxID=451379 RepID=A0A0N5ATB1_9BILA